MSFQLAYATAIGRIGDGSLMLQFGGGLPLSKAAPKLELVPETLSRLLNHHRRLLGLGPSPGLGTACACLFPATTPSLMDAIDAWGPLPVASMAKGVICFGGGHPLPHEFHFPIRT